MATPQLGETSPGSPWGPGCPGRETLHSLAQGRGPHQHSGAALPQSAGPGVSGGAARLPATVVAAHRAAPAAGLAAGRPELQGRVQVEALQATHHFYIESVSHLEVATWEWTEVENSDKVEISNIQYCNHFLKREC